MKKIKKLSELENYIIPKGISKYIDLLPVVDHFYVEEMTEETIDKCVVEGPFHLFSEKRNLEKKEDFEDLQCPCVLIKTYPFDGVCKVSHRHPHTGVYGSYSTLERTKEIEALLRSTEKLDDRTLFKVGFYRNKAYFYDAKEMDFSEEKLYKAFFIPYTLNRLSFDINKIVVMGAFFKVVEDFYQGHFNFEDKSLYYKNHLTFKHMDVEGMLIHQDPQLKKWKWLINALEGKGDKSAGTTHIKRLEEVIKMYEPEEAPLIKSIDHLVETIYETPLSIIQVDRIIDCMNKVMHYYFLYKLDYEEAKKLMASLTEGVSVDTNLSNEALGQLSLYNPAYYLYSFDFMSFEYYSEFANRFGHFLSVPYEYGAIRHNRSKKELDQWIESIYKAKLNKLDEVDITRETKRQILKQQALLLPKRVAFEKWQYHFNRLASLLRDTLEECGDQQGIENLYDMHLSNLEQKE